MRLDPPPPSAGWRHESVRTGYEIVFFRVQPAGPELRGHTAAREGAALWSVSYRILLAGDWSTRSVSATSSSADGDRRVVLAPSAEGGWTVDGLPRSDLDGCVDVDFESSAVTNTLPVHRLEFDQGTPVPVPAAFVRADDLRVERIEQTYTLLEGDHDRLRFHYESTTFGFECELTFDRAGLVLTYPGIATRDW